MQRIIDLSQSAAYLRVRNDQLLINVNDRTESVPLEEVAVLIVAHPAVTYTHAVLAGICQHGGSILLCDGRRLPAGLLLPYSQHFAQSERFALQLAMSSPSKKQLWRQIVAAKIMAQGRLLARYYGDDNGLLMLATKVRSGDAGNCEGVAARRYWQALLGTEFRRLPRSDDPLNILLDYGYGVLRALTARAICAVGFHPSLGLHHHNRYDAFCLADDLMEPFRPLVDETVLNIRNCSLSQLSLDKQTKTILINRLVVRRYSVAHESRLLFDIVSETASSMVQAAGGRSAKLHLPELKYEKEEETDSF